MLSCFDLLSFCIFEIQYLLLKDAKDIDGAQFKETEFIGKYFISSDNPIFVKFQVPFSVRPTCQ